MLITQEIRQQLLEMGISLFHHGQFTLPNNCVFEPPCSLMRVQVLHSLEMGAFSTAKSGYFFATKIGRYCSIEENVQIGRGSHPVTWGSTSPVLYQDHTHVFNEKIEEAKGFLINANLPSAKITKIGNDVHIGFGSLIKQGVTVGDGAIIKPMSVVSKDVPPFSVIEGNPGVITGLRFSLEVATRLRQLAWWDFAFWDFHSDLIENPQTFLEYLDIEMRNHDISPYCPKKISLNDSFGEKQ